MKKYSQRLFNAVKNCEHDRTLHFIAADVRSYKTKRKMLYGLYLDSVSSFIGLVIPVLLIAALLGAAWGLMFGQNFDVQMFAITLAIFGCQVIVRFFILYWACNIESELAHESGQNMFGG